MILHVSKSPSSNEVEHISFPADAGKVRYAMIGLEEFGGWAPAYIVGGEGPAEALIGYISRDDLYSEDGVEKLNRLAGLADTMDLEAQKVFAGALRAESINGLDDVLRAASNLGQYEFIEGVTTDKELGGWLVEHGKAGVEFPEEVRPYLDYAGIGRSYYADHGGAYTPSGYVKRREVVQAQKKADLPAFALTLVSSAGSVRFDLPAQDDALEQAKRALGVDSLDSAVIGDVEIGYPWAHLLPMDSVTLEDANTLAECVRAMSNRELKVFGAALEVEEPRSFYDAGCIAMDIDDYELVDSNEGEYGRETLRKAGADDEILDMLDGFTDFDALGRSEMEADGVRETSFGHVRRLSAPWPEQGPEMGQTMG